MNSIKILLIEDNEGDILLIQEAFEEANIVNQTIVIRDGEKAMQYIGGHTEKKDGQFPDLILLDINLPKVDGHEVLKYIKSQEKIKKTPVIMLTTSSTPMDIMKAYDNFVNCFITKPFEMSDFLKVVAQIEMFWFQLVKLPSGYQK